MLRLELHLRLAGAGLIVLGLAHIWLPRALGWRRELHDVSLLTRQVLTVHTFFIGLACVLFGSLSLLFARQLMAPSTLARALLIGAVVYWGSRLFIQLFVFDSSLWRGRRLTVLGHVAFTAMWAYYVAVFSFALARQFT